MIDVDTIVRLRIVSATMNPEAITQAVGLPCDMCLRMGEPRVPGARILAKENEWLLHSGLPKSATFQQHVNTMLDLVEGSRHAIRRLSETETVEFSIVMYCRESPDTHLDREAVARIAALGASIDIDLYFLPARGSVEGT